MFYSAPPRHRVPPPICSQPLPPSSDRLFDLMDKMMLHSFYPTNKTNKKLQKTIYVEESGHMIPRGIKYDGAVLSISSLKKTRRIFPGTVDSFSLVNGGNRSFFVLYTTEFGRIEFNVRRIIDASTIQTILESLN